MNNKLKRNEDVNDNRKISHKKSDESKRNTKWVSFSKSKVSFGFQHLGPAYVPAMSAERKGMAVCLEKIGGWSVPQQVLKEFGKGDYEITAQLSFSMFHLNSSTFFGSTWMGPSVSLGNSHTKIPKIIDFDYVDIVYMISRITDPSCVGVIEIVVSKFDSKRNLVASQFGCGWTMLNLFLKPLCVDIADGHENIPLKSCALFAGSPRDLIMNNDINSLASRLKEMPDCSLFYKLCSHRRLLKAQHIISENECIGRFDVVAGLISRKAIPPGTGSSERLLACIGDEERFDDRLGNFCLPAKPELAMAATIKIANFQFLLSDRSSAEVRLLEDYDPSSKTKLVIQARYLKIGLHNGHSLVGGGWKTFALVDDESDPDVLLTRESVLVLGGYVPNEYMALVVMVQYDVGSPHNTGSHANSAAIVKAMGPVLSDDKRSAVGTITLGSALFIPSDGRTIALRNTPSRGTSSGGGVDIELALLRDELCSLLSPSPDAVDAQQPSVLADQKTHNRLSMTADHKSDAKSLGNSNTRGMNVATSSVPEVGFDLKVVHPTLGELSHGDNVEALLVLAESGKRGTDRVFHGKTPEWTEQTSVSDAGEDNHSFERDMRDASSRNSPKPRKSTFQSREFRDEEEASEDDRSISESIVTGNSEQSGFRLDPAYYASAHNRQDAQRVRLQVPEVEAVSAKSKPVSSNINLADNKQSLFGLSMQAALRSVDQAGRRSTGELLTHHSNPNRKTATKSSVRIESNTEHSRDVSRGAKSRLNRYGFQGTVEDSRSSKLGNSRAATAVVDIELEARDPLSLHEINIQFAAFRSVVTVGHSQSGSLGQQHTGYCPRNAFCSFQFYTCQSTKTEVMRLVSSQSGESCVFVRDDPHARNETPLSLRYLVDTSCGSPHEAVEFADYLAHNALYVDLWDADSLLLLGTFAVPLQRLLRQGQSSVRHTIECDVISVDGEGDLDGGISSCVVADGGPVVGAVVGAVQIIISNYGQKGAGDAHSTSLTTRDSRGADDDQEFNWRTLGDGSSFRNNNADKVGVGSAGRPKHCTRARPLSEVSPQLSLALQGVRDSAGGDHNSSSSASMRSLTAARGGSSLCTLTYDEVSVLFRRFQGHAKGTVQYSGDLMLLLDLPSWTLALRRLLQAYRRYGDRGDIDRELSRHSSGDGVLGQKDLEEFFAALFDKSGMQGREEDRTLLASRMVAEFGTHGSMSQRQLVRFCDEEIDREDWTLCSRRVRLAADSAYAAGEDVQQRLCEHDVTGSHSISSLKFRDFLSFLSKFGRIQDEDRSLCVRHFSRLSTTASKTQSSQQQEVSLKDVMAFLGRDYVGNLQVRIQRSLRTGGIISAKDVVSLLTKHRKEGPGDRCGGSARLFSFRDVEAALGELGIFAEVTHEQLHGVLKMLDAKGNGLLSCKQVLVYLGVEYLAGDIPGKEDGAKRQKDEQHSSSVGATKTLNIEDMLRILLEKVQSNGLVVDEAFRHFDTDGDGSISVTELEQALDNLCIFRSISGWKEQIPALLSKFDTSGDGQVSLKEFFKFLGMSGDYAPNIVQKMTNIFAIATQKGLSIKDIFTELDVDCSGALNADELQGGLKKIGTFGEITAEDAAAVVKRFDVDGDKKVSTEEFVSFFEERIQRKVKDRGRKVADKKPVVRQFREVMAAVQSKGLSAKALFGHIDKDKGGSISTDEFAAVLARLPQFKDMPPAALQEIFLLIDNDSSGGISLSEFEQFLADSVDRKETFKSPPASLSDRVRDVFKTAASKGLSFSKTFHMVDQNGDGQLTVSELESALRKLPHFSAVERREVEVLFDSIDTDGSGLIAIEEFQRFAESGVPLKDRTSSKRVQPSVRLSHSMSDSEFSDEFVRLVNGVMTRNSSIFARLDEDEDGLVEMSTVLRSLSKSGVFDSLSEARAEALMSQFIVQRKFISLELFMSFLGARHSAGKSANQKHHSKMESKNSEGDDNATTILVRDYDFSANPEIKALEKKVRGFGKVLAKKGVDVEAMFRDFDAKHSGSVRRSELVEVLSRMGMHILEQGRTFDHALFPADDLRRSQVRQINRLKDGGGDYIRNAPRLARQALLRDGNSASHGAEFTDHIESMSLVNSYRNSQKQMLLQRVLSHNLEKSIRIYPRFGTALFFEHPITNPFGHEERFQIEVSDPELRVVTSFDEWLHLRRNCRPCVGAVGSDPVEAEMFDADGQGHVQLVLLPYETLHIPFTFLTLLPTADELTSSSGRRPADERAVTSGPRAFESRDDSQSESSRSTEVRIVSATHGHVVAVLKVFIHPKPFILHRTLRFFEPEKSVMKRRILLVGNDNMSTYPGDFTMAARYIHCVECGEEQRAGQSQVVVEWGPSGETFAGLGSLDILLRYRCAAFPNGGMFYLLIFSDPYQSRLHEIWQVVVNTRQKLDIHGCVGSVVSTDLVVRGDRYARRAKAYVSQSDAFRVSCQPDAVFQLVPGAYNRVSLNLVSKVVGYSRLQVSLVDVDSRELISAWVAVVSSSAPSVMRSYEVEVGGQAIHKKIVYSNPWDVTRRFTLTSSDESVMRPRSTVMDVGPRGTAYLRLWFAGSVGGEKDVHLFLNDNDGGQSEECYLFQVNKI